MGASREYLLQLPLEEGARLLHDASAVYKVITEKRSGGILDLGDIWAGLHFLLSVGEPPMPRHVALARGLAWDEHSLENLLMGGEPTPYEDAFTVARYLAPVAVTTLAQQVARLTTAQFSARFDDGVYDVLPLHWRTRADTCAVLVSGFEQLVVFYQTAEQADHGILQYVI